MIWAFCRISPASAGLCFFSSRSKLGDCQFGSCTETNAACSSADLSCFTLPRKLLNGDDFLALAGSSVSTVGTPAFKLISLTFRGSAFSALAACRIIALFSSSSEESRRIISHILPNNSTGVMSVMNNAVIRMRTIYIRATIGFSARVIIILLATSPITPPASGRAAVFSSPNSPLSHTTSKTAAIFMAIGNRLFSARKVSTAIYTNNTGRAYIA